MGFSLLEVLIALALTVLLLSAVYAAVDLYWKFESAGRLEMARAQITRALVQRMNEDLGSIVFRLPEPEYEDEFGELLDESPAPGSSLTLGGLEESAAPITFGIVGDSELLHLTVSKPSRELSYSDILGEGPLSRRTSDLLIASYGMAPDLLGPTSAAGFPGEFGPASQRGGGASQRPQVGFGRRFVDLYAMQAAPEMLGPEDVVAPEITQVRFRYFDGADWLDAWDSRFTGALPRAIEVTFGYWNEPPRRRPRMLDTSPGTVTPVQHVFQIPLSRPLMDDLFAF